MPNPQDTLLHYRLVEQIGEGGMGVVWRATDTTLDREVAIKVLPAEFAAAADRLARFEREAKLLATLNHPNVAAIYGLHEAGGVRFIAMELVGGEDLSQRIARAGALPVAEALEVTAQVCEAFAAAHDAGVIHRDLKPANVMLTGEGKIKVLDFGLAKALAGDPASGSDVSASLSPTITSLGTQAGMILGTAAYMSPEQARGNAVDRRADIWALGCLMYEMLTGNQPFTGETVTDVLAAIIRQDPDWDALPPDAPAGLRRLLQRCLRRDARERMRDMGDVGVLVADAAADAGAVTDTPSTTTSGPARLLWPAVAAVLAVALVYLVVTRNDTGSADPASGVSQVTSMIRLTDLPGRQDWPSLSPDGKQLLYVSIDGGDRDIFLQRVGGEKAINLTEDSPGHDTHPAFSPDGEQIAFNSDRGGGGIFVMGATGESPRKITDHGYHPAWSPDGTRLLYGEEGIQDPYGRSVASRLFVVDVATREHRVLFEGDVDVSQARWSPGGRRIAFWSWWAGIQGQRDILTIPAEGGEPVAVTRDVHTDWEPQWSPDGRWLYFISDRSGSPDLWRVPIDESSGELRGALQAVTTGIARVMQASLSADGKRVALTAGRESGAIRTVAFDPVNERVVGERRTIFASADTLAHLDLSADAKRIAYRTTSPGEHIWVMGADGSGRRRLIREQHRTRGPKWSPDGRWLVFYSNRTGSYEVWAMRPDGTDLRQVTDAADRDLSNPRWSPDGRRISFSMIGNDVQAGWVDLGPGGLDDLDQPLAEVETPGSDGMFVQDWSPDGRWIAAYDVLQQTVAFYSVEQKSILQPRDSEGKPYHGSGGDWIDDRRFLVWDPERATGLAIELPSLEVREVSGIPDSDELWMTADGGRLFYNEISDEYDVWLLTLE